MDYSRREVRAAQVARREIRGPDATALQTITQAALAAETMTGDPAWDRMLSFIQAALEEAKQAKQAAESALVDPRVVNHEAILLLKMNAALAAERIRTLDAVIRLPADLKREGAKAKLQLEALDAGRDGQAAA
jgi:hypothetical protein